MSGTTIREAEMSEGQLLSAKTTAIPRGEKLQAIPTLWHVSVITVETYASQKLQLIL